MMQIRIMTNIVVQIKQPAATLKTPSKKSRTKLSSQHQTKSVSFFLIGSLPYQEKTKNLLAPFAPLRFNYWLAVEEIGHPAAEVARTLGISRVGVLLSLEKAKETRPKYGFELTPPTLQIQYVEK
jgi:hypothetical protein